MTKTNDWEVDVLQPVLAEEWATAASSSGLSYAKHSVLALGLWSDRLPVAHDWVFHDAEALGPVLAKLSDPNDVARTMTVAVGDDCAAYAHMLLWKIHELISATVDSLNSHHLVGAAASARSAVEATISLAMASYRQNQVFAGTDAKGVPGRLAELSERMDKLVWGRKGPNKVLEAINVLTLKDQLVAFATDPETQEQLQSVYAELCDVVHPSASGHQLHWQPEVKVGDEGPILVPLRYGQPTMWGVAVGELCLWSIGWASSWSVRAFDGIVAESARWAAIASPPP